MINPILLSNAQQLDLDLAFASESFDGLDPDSAAYISWIFTNGPIPEGKLLARTCHSLNCVNPSHLALVDSRASTSPPPKAITYEPES
jgi:hypothetical protein